MSQKRVRERILRRARAAGIDLAPSALEALNSYFSELAKWNRKINLTALAVEADGSDEAVDRLLIEPLIAARFVPESATRLIDIGSGGGSPAIPMKVARPGLSLTMVEVKVRKSAFLRQVARLLLLPETVVENTRFETLLSRPELHESFDVLTVRAVRVDRSTLTGLQAFVRPGGIVMNFTGNADQPDVVPPLALEQIHTLVAENSSRLIILKKRQVGVRST